MIKITFHMCTKNIFYISYFKLKQRYFQKLLPQNIYTLCKHNFHEFIIASVLNWFPSDGTLLFSYLNSDTKKMTRISFIFQKEFKLIYWKLKNFGECISLIVWSQLNINFQLKIFIRKAKIYSSPLSCSINTLIC